MKKSLVVVWAEGNTAKRNNMKPTIFIASDHGGLSLKKTLSEHIGSFGYEVIDLGPENLDPHDDYPDFAFKVAQKVSSRQNSLGILICRNGIGMSIAVNKVKGIRAGLCSFLDQAITAKTDDNCNIIVLPADFISKEKAIKIVDTFLNTAFSKKERHIRRLTKITNYETRLGRQPGD